MALATAATPGSRPLSLLPRPFVVAARRRETHDSVTLTLRPPADAQPFAFAPGQFCMLYAFGRGEVPISIGGDPGQRETLVHTIRAVGTVSAALVASAPGTTIGVRGPFGSAWPLDGAEGLDVVVVAGGIGLAPLRPAILAILAARARYGRLRILYGARTPADVLYRRELARWQQRTDVFVDVTVDRATPAWTGRVGVVTRLIEAGGFDPAHTLALVCGPEPMMRFAAETLTAVGVGAERIFVSWERNMHCAVGICGHCQFGPHFVCRDGPVFALDRIAPLMRIKEL